MELAQLDPTEQDETTATPVIGASVVFNINGVPGLSHLQAQSTDTISDTVDAEYTEIITTDKPEHTHNDELGEL